MKYPWNSHEIPWLPPKDYASPWSWSELEWPCNFTKQLLLANNFPRTYALVHCSHSTDLQRYQVSEHSICWLNTTVLEIQREKLRCWTNAYNGITNTKFTFDVGKAGDDCGCLCNQEWTFTTQHQSTSWSQASIFQEMVAISLLTSDRRASLSQPAHDDCPALVESDCSSHSLDRIQGSPSLSKKQDTFSRGEPRVWIQPFLMYFTMDATKHPNEPAILEISTPLHGMSPRGSSVLSVIAGTVRLRWNLLSVSWRRTCQAELVLCALKRSPHVVHWTGTIPSKDKILYLPGRWASTHWVKVSRDSMSFGRPRPWRARLCAGLELSSTTTCVWLASALACSALSALGWSGLACSGLACSTRLKALARLWHFWHGLTCTPAKLSKKSCQCPFSRWPRWWTWKCRLKSSPALAAMDWPMAACSRHHRLFFLEWSVKRSLFFALTGGLTGGGVSKTGSRQAGGGVTINGLAEGGTMAAAPAVFLCGVKYASSSFSLFCATLVNLAKSPSLFGVESLPIAALTAEGLDAEGLSSATFPLEGAPMFGTGGSSKPSTPCSMGTCSKGCPSWNHRWTWCQLGGAVSSTSKQCLGGGNTLWNMTTDVCFFPPAVRLGTLISFKKLHCYKSKPENWKPKPGIQKCRVQHPMVFNMYLIVSDGICGRSLYNG